MGSEQHEKTEIFKRYLEKPDEWIKVSLEHCLEMTENKGYYQPGTVLEQLRDGASVYTDFAEFKMGINKED